MAAESKPFADKNLSFSGCGFLGFYHIGVAKCFLEYAPEVFSGKVSGTSAGALAAVAVVCELDLKECADRILAIARKAREYYLTAFSRKFYINQMIRNLLEEYLPNDCHEKANGRLHISVTRLDGSKNKIISQFESKEDVIQALLCSSFIPNWSNAEIPTIDGVKYIDGAFSVNQPILDENTITVSPFFARSTNICPNDFCPPDCYYEINLFMKFALTSENLKRLLRMLAPYDENGLNKIMSEGYEDARRYLFETYKN